MAEWRKESKLLGRLPGIFPFHCCSGPVRKRGPNNIQVLEQLEWFIMMCIYA